MVDLEIVSGALKRKSGLHDPRRVANGGTVFLPRLQSTVNMLNQDQVRGLMEKLLGILLPGVAIEASSAESLQLDPSTIVPRCW